MPQAIAAAIVGAIGLTGAAAVVATAVIALGISVGLSVLAASIFAPGRPKPSDGQQQSRQSVGSRRRHYGIVHTAGQLTFFESSNGTLAQVLTLGTGREAEILEHRINDKPVTVAAGTVTDASYRGALHIYTRPGADDQTAIAELTSQFPQWTADHRQRGCAHAAVIADPVKQKYFSEVFNGRMPEYTQVRKAALVYDPRKDDTAGGTGSQRVNDPSSWAWSDNAALVIADYLAHPDGFGIGYDNVNWTNIAREADEAAIGVTTVTGAVIERWRLWASYDLVRDERRQVLTDLLKACDGFCWQDADAKFNLKLGRFETPAFTLTDDHIKGMVASLGPDATKRVSAIKVLYTEASIGYREQESATVGGDGVEDPNTAPQQLEAYYAPHHNQAVRVGKLTYRRLGDDRWHITAELNLYGLNLIGERFCRLESDQLGVSGYFMIEGVSLRLKEMRVVAKLTQVDPSDWTFDAPTEEGTPPASSATTSPIGSIAVPTGITLTAVQIAFGDGAGVAIQASWDAPAREGLIWIARYRPTAGGDWVTMTVDEDTRSARSGPVSSGVQYEVQVRAVTIGLRSSDWSPSVTITPSTDATIAAPTDLTATGGTGSASISFRMPTSPSLAYARLYRNTSSSFSGAVQVGGDIVGALGEVKTVTDSGLTAGTYFYWVRAFKSSGGSSALTGPASATIT